MTHTFHCHLRRSFRWYNNWHNHPHHQHAHWSAFIITAIFVFSFISNSFSGLYFEQNIAHAQAGLTLGISGDRFTINGQQQFLLMVSYFDAMNASDATLNSDFAQLKSRGFSGVRIITNWNPPGNPGQLMDVNGNLRPGMLSRLVNIAQKAQTNNLIVDMTFTRDTIPGLSAGNYKNGVVAAAQGLTAYRNLYFDLQNEADHGMPNPTDPPRLTPAEVKQIRDAVKAVDPQRIVGVSGQATSGSITNYISQGMDMNLLHGPLSSLSGIRTWVSQARSATPGIPVHMQEPDRCRATSCAYTASQFITAAQDTKCSGGAGFTFHTSAGYSLSGNTMFNQWLDPGVENGVINGMSSAVSGTTWGSCGNSIAPPAPPPPSNINGQRACRVDIISDCGIGGANTPAWFSPVFDNMTYYRYPKTAALPSTFPTITAGACPYNVPNEFAIIQQYANLITDNTCSDPDRGQPPTDYTFLNAVVTALHNKNPNWGYTGFGANGISGDEVTYYQPTGQMQRVLNFAAPDFAPVGTSVILSGENMAADVYFINSTGTITPLTGKVNADLSEVTVTLPLSLAPGNYNVRVGSNASSNQISFKVIPGIATAGPVGIEIPIITNIDPLTITQGGSVTIYGDFLSDNIYLIGLDGTYINISGWVSSDSKTATFNVPADIATGAYSVGVINFNGSTTAENVLTITEASLVPGPNAQSIPPPTTESFESLITSAFNYAILFVGIAVFIVILWAGFLWLTSGANPGNISTAKRMISNAIFGAIILFAAYVILYTINPELVGGGFNLEGLPATEPLPSVSPPPSSSCNNLPALAQRYNVPFPARNSANLSVLITCLGDNATVSNLMDINQLYTYENSNDSCNFTRGNPICGKCAHTKNSCHYGGATGNDGAEAADYNARNSSQAGEQQLYNAINALKTTCDIGYIKFEKTSDTSWHTHVSTSACDGN